MNCKAPAIRHAKVGDTVEKDLYRRQWNYARNRYEGAAVRSGTEKGTVIEVERDAKGRHRLRIKWAGDQPRTWRLESSFDRIFAPDGAEVILK